MEITASEEHPENAAAQSAPTKLRADSNSEVVSGYRGLNDHGTNDEISDFRKSCYFHVTAVATNEVIRPETTTSLLRADNSFS
jgi:hypothetical protein